jgi:general secretion pathway protein D
MMLARNIRLLIIVSIFTVAGLSFFFPLERVWCARLAGEDQTVTTGSAAPPVPVPSRPVDRKDAPAKMEAVQSATGQTTPQAATAPPRAVFPGALPKAAVTPNAAPSSPPGSSQTPVGAIPPPPQEPITGSAGPSSGKMKGTSVVLQQPQSQPALPPQPPQPKQAGAASLTGQYVTINFDDVDIRVLIKFVSELTGRNFLLDERVKGKVTVISPRKIAVDEVYKVLESVLEIYGFTTVPAGEVIKVVPTVEARGKNMELRLNRDSGNAEDKIVTQILSLQHASPDEMKKILDPLVSKNSIILSYPPTGMLIITDVSSNIKRLQEIVTALDVEGAGDEISYIPLKSASAVEIVKGLMVVFAPQRAGVAQMRLVADERTNSVILVARQQITGHVKQLISLMDKEIPRSGTILHVYRLQNGNAEDMTKVLMNLPKDPKDPKAAPVGTPTAGRGVSLSKDVNVVADKATNTLIITASRDDYKTLEEIIRQLDEPRPMVYIEALIMEVSVTKNFNVGVEWRGLKEVGNASLSGLGANATGLGVAGFTGSSIIPQASSTGALSLPAGLSLGVIGAGIQIGDILFPNIGAVLQAYQKDSDVSILATPQLLTLNNEDAEINVGKNVPYITRSDTSVTVPGQVYGQSYEYKDVGIVLKITPNINEDQFVRLKIDQQLTKLAGEQTSTPTTFKRAAKTTVVIKDKETVVIGGLIDDSSSIDTQQVPCLGDIPFLGWLFKTRGSGYDKSNLYIFITPHIVRNQAEAAALYKKKLDDVSNIEEGVIKMNGMKAFQKPQTDRKE